MSGFESLMYQGAVSAVGDPTILGLLVFGFFLGFVTVQGQSFAGKIAILVPAVILALALVPYTVTVVVGLVLGFILFLAVNKFITR